MKNIQKIVSKIISNTSPSCKNKKCLYIEEFLHYLFLPLQTLFLNFIPLHQALILFYFHIYQLEHIIHFFILILHQFRYQIYLSYLQELIFHLQYAFISFYFYSLYFFFLLRILVYLIILFE